MKKGISLVALVITIIVLIIITGTVVLTLNKDNNNIINRAKEATKNYSAKEAQEILIASLMQYKADMIASRGSEGNLADMIAYFDEKGIDISVVDLSNVMAGEENVSDMESVLNTNYDFQWCARDNSEIDSIVNEENVFLKLKGNDYLFAMNVKSFELKGEVKEIGNTTVIKDAINEIEMLEEIIFKVKQAGLDINAENLQANNTYSDLVTIESYVNDTDMAEEMVRFTNNNYEISKLAKGGLSTGYRIKRAITLVAQATFNTSGMVYNIRANGVIEANALAENITSAESQIRDVDMEEEMNTSAEGQIRDTDMDME